MYHIVPSAMPPSQCNSNMGKINHSVVTFFYRFLWSFPKSPFINDTRSEDDGVNLEDLS